MYGNHIFFRIVLKETLTLFSMLKVKVQRTLNWVLSQDSDSGSGSGTSGQSTPEPGMIQPPVQQMKRNEVDNNLNVPDTLPTPVTSKPFTMPTNSMNTALDSVWTDQGNS